MDNKKIQEIFLEIRSNKFFEFSVIAIIIFTALLAGAKTYDLPDYVLNVIHTLDWSITILFSIELTIRFMGEEVKRNFFRQWWNVFDFVIIVVSILPFENSEYAAVGRLIRIFRVLRLIAIVPELRLLIHSLMKALPELGYVVALMFVLFYIYAAVGSTLFAEINPAIWGDISVAFLTLFQVMTFDNWRGVVSEVMQVYPLAWVYFISFIFLTSFAFLNMVIGIVCNTIEEVHDEERAKKDKEAGKATIEDLSNDLKDIKVMLSNAHQEIFELKRKIGDFDDPFKHK